MAANRKRKQITIEHTNNFHELAKLNETVQKWHHEHYPDEFKPFDMNAIESAFEQMFRKQEFFAFIAKHQDKSIGYLIGYVKNRPGSAFQYKKSVLYIDQIAIVAEYQKNGVGQILMEEAYGLAQLNKIKEVQLDFWTGNQLAESFFLKSGFNYFNHKMRKQLPADKG